MPKKKLTVSAKTEKDEEEGLKTKKVLVEDERPCPFCGKEIHISWTRVTKVEPIRGEYQHDLILERSSQTTLEGT